MLCYIATQLMRDRRTIIALLLLIGGVEPNPGPVKTHGELQEAKR